jgi:hypothetical protein
VIFNEAIPPAAVFENCSELFLYTPHEILVEEGIERFPREDLGQFNLQRGWL